MKLENIEDRMIRIIPNKHELTDYWEDYIDQIIDRWSGQVIKIFPDDSRIIIFNHESDRAFFRRDMHRNFFTD